MRVTRPLTALGIIASLSLMGCGGTVAPSASLTQSESSPSAPGPSSAPSQSASLAPSAAPAAWLGAGELNEARDATHVAVVGDGQVLVVGSDNICFPATGGSDSVELGDPLTGAWEKTASLRSPRDGPVLVGLPDGRALLTGGLTGEDDGPVAFSSTYIFDPAATSWLRSGLLNTARARAAATVLTDGRVLVAGGLFMDLGQSPLDLDTAELWDPSTGAWTRTGRLAGPRLDASAVTLADGRVLIVGGVDSNAEQNVLATAEIFDPQTGEWASAGELATLRAGYSLVALPDGGAIAAGGRGEQGGSILSMVERFDPGSSSWSPAASLPGPVSGATGVELADGRVLLAGGSDKEPVLIDAEAGTFVTGLTADAKLYDPTTDTWTTTAPMPRPRGGASAVLLPDGTAVLAGGYLNEGDLLFATPGCYVSDPGVFRYAPGS
jgi:N-acetylneuraminic acid mutarotase